jgi:uncharacterized oxidoreductase
MPTLNAEQLFDIGRQILQAAGASAEEAAVVAKELAAANLVGHDSHGVMRLMQYVDHIEQNFIRPGSPITEVKDSAAYAILDGHFNFGQVTAIRGLEIAQQKARTAGTATVFLRNCNHVGRLGSYSHQAAMHGFASMMVVNAPGPGGVAPFGAIDQRLGTNPISMSAPCGDDALVLDMTTSATAEGKVRVAHQKGEKIPAGLLIDSMGNPSTDPADLYADPPGAILPLGGPLGFKGSGLSMMIDVFGGILSGSGVCRTDLPRGANGVWMYLVDVSHFVDKSVYDPLMKKYVEHIKSSRCLPGVEEILLPGEIERRRESVRRTEGVEIPPETWRQITELATRLGTTLLLRSP